MISELIEVLLYVSLIPCLKVPLRSLADVLMCSEETLTTPHSNAVFTAQVMNRSCNEDFIGGLSELSN